MLVLGAVSVEELIARGPMDESPELRLLFHRLNNQLGIILAHAELLEAKAADDMHRARRAGRRQRPRSHGYCQRNPLLPESSFKTKIVVLASYF